MDDTQEIIITESEMDFGPFSSDNLFHIEKSDAYKDLGEGFSTVEFVSIRNEKGKNVLRFVEAKSSSPNPNNREIPNFINWIADVAKKFNDSFQLFLSVHSGVRTSDDIGKNISNTALKDCSIRFIVVITNHPIEYLPPISDALQREIRKLKAIWKINIIVLNKEQALLKHLIV